MSLFSINGWLALDKPLGLSSTQAVGVVKRLLRPKKIGHGGTLDPLATGVLPLALGEATKTVAYLMDAEKEYRFTVRFGIQTDTDDTEGKPIASSDVRPSDAEIQAALPGFLGDIEQMPPIYSALKIKGERAYDLARAGQEVVLQPRRVHIRKFILRERPDPDHAVFEVVCGKGTYVRALGRDLAKTLGGHGHIAALRRTRVGIFEENSTFSLDSLEKMVHSAALEGLPLLPPERALDDIPAIRILPEIAGKLRRGQAFFLSRAELEEQGLVADEETCRAMCEERLVALVKRQGRRCQPVRVFQGNDA